MLVRLSDEGVNEICPRHTKAFVKSPAEAWVRLRDMLCAVPKGAALIVYGKNRNDRYDGCIFSGCAGYWNPVDDSIKVKGGFSEFEGFSSAERCIRMFGAGGKEMEVDVVYDRFTECVEVRPHLPAPPQWSISIKDVRIGYTKDGSAERYKEIEFWEPR